MKNEDKMIDDFVAIIEAISTNDYSNLTVGQCILLEKIKEKL
jgi:hypothetical protein